MSRNHDYVGQALKLLADGLERFVDERMRVQPDSGGYQWVEHLPIRYPDRGWRGTGDSTEDPRFLLRVLTEEWRAFQPELSRVHSGYASELREMGNAWAHHHELADDDVDRMFDTMVRLLRVAGPVPQIGELRALRDEFRRRQETPDEPLGRVAESVSSPAGPSLASAAPAPTIAVTSPTATPATADAPSVAPPVISAPTPDDGPTTVEIRDLGNGQRDVALAAFGVRVVVTYRESVNYALVHNQVSPLVQILLSSANQEPVEVDGLAFRLESAARSDQRSFPPVTLQPGDSVTLDSSRLEWALDHTQFADLEEATAARLLVEARINGAVHVAEAPIRLLARNEWNGLVVPELLAAFITPNAPEISDLLSRVSGVLAERTSDPSLQGYQAGRERALEIGAAIYDVLAGYGIRYVNPPASFETDGQKIRPVETVLGERWGTCLDLALTFSAAVEQAGLNPVIVLQQGHAFAGFLVTDSKLSDVVLTDSTMMSNLVRSNLLVTVDLTAAVEGRSLPFDAARAATEEYWDPARIDDVWFLLDVAAARRRIRPLPRLLRTDGGVVVEVERPAFAPLPSLTGTAGTPGQRPGEPAYPVRVERWRTSLLDLSLRNPLLKLKKTSGVELHVPEQALARFEDFLAAEKPLHVRSGQDLPEIHLAQGISEASGLPAAELAEILNREHVVYARTLAGKHSAQLDRMRRQARTVLEETGANNLFVTLGAIKWFDARGNEALAPMFLLPVTLAGSSRTPFTVRIDEGAEALPNYCLIEKLRRDFGVTLTTLQSPPNDSHGLDIPGLMRETREQIVGSGARLAVESHVRLAMLQFSTLEMWRDVSENWDAFTHNQVVKHLIKTPNETFIDTVGEPALDARDEATRYLPVPVDGSQLKAISWATAGRTFVLEGPPGTGKSQTITNMIADALGHGKSVLFVAEKQAALEIVRGRLERVGLGPLVLDLHGRTQTIKSVREQLVEAWEFRSPGGAEHLTTLREQHLSLIRKLEDYPHALHAVEGKLPSVWSAEQTVLSLERGLPEDLRQLADPRHVHGRILSGTVDEADIYEAAYELGEAIRLMAGREADPAWHLAANPVASLDFDLIDTRVRDLARAHEAIGAQLKSVLRTSDEVSAWSELVPWLRDAESGQAITPQELATIESSSWDQQASDLLAAVASFEQRFGALLQAVGGHQQSIDTHALSSSLDSAESAGFFHRRKATERAIGAVSAATGIVVQHSDQARGLLRDIDALREAAAHIAGRAAHVLGVTLLPGSFDFAFVEPRVLDIQRRVGNARRALDRVPAAAALVSDASRLDVAVGTADALVAFQRAWTAALEAFLPRRIDMSRWQGFGTSLVERISESLPSWLAEADHGIHTYVKRQRNLQLAVDRLSGLGMQHFVDKAVRHEIPSDHLEHVVRLALARARRDERLEHTQLDAFRPAVRDRNVAQYVQTTSEVRDELARQLPARIVQQRRPGPATHHARGSFLAEIKRRRGGTIRELFSTHGDEVLATTPCVLMSPYSVAKFIPADAVQFDLVVFDEASQIRVADAIGPMGRGRAVVVVGDSQQMPPTSMFETSEIDVETDEDELEAGLTPADQESILSEAVAANLEKLRLTWHYRSQDERLIAFSNDNYYRGELSTFPTPPVSRQGFGIRLVSVNGVFDGGRGGTRTNRAEAERIVQEIQARLRADEAASIGVVTFNSQQRDLLLDLLEGSNDRLIAKALIRESDFLFVKNLENVQGDERDTILFSIAFSPDPVSGRLRLNFGPLTAQGGERRLNVAITRARREVVLFTSFGPAAIDLSRTSSTGMHHLRAYLEYASRGPEGRLASRLHESNLYRDRLADALRDSGLEVETDLGLSSFRVDLAVRPPGSANWLAVLLDGPEWAHRPLVSDREGLPTSVLVGTMGWPDVHRIWLPMWLRQPEAVIAEVQEAARAVAASATASSVSPPAEFAPAVEGLNEEDDVDVAALSDDPRLLSIRAPVDTPTISRSSTTPPGVLPPRSVELSEAVPSERVAPGAQPSSVREVAPPKPRPARARRFPPRPNAPTKSWFKPAPTHVVGDREVIEDLANKHNRESIRSELLDVIASEGPVEEHRLARIVGTRFGMSRVHESRRVDILSTLPRGYIAKDLLGDRYFWPTGMNPATYSTFRASSEKTRRAITEIPGEEIANAAVHLVSVHGPVETGELIEQLKVTFGFSRLGKDIGTKFFRVLEILTSEGALNADGARLSIGDLAASDALEAANTSALGIRGQVPASDLTYPDPMVERVLALDADQWFALSHWAKENGVLEGWQRKIAFSLGVVASEGRIPSERQVAQGVRILREIADHGYGPE